MFFTAIDQLIGNTPLLQLTRIEQNLQLNANILAKLEYLNPAGSVKDRVAKAMLDEAEANGTIAPGATIIEPTSGNTGIGLVAVAATRGYKTIIVMPDTMSEERRKLMKAYGAELVLTDGAKGMQGSIEKAEQLAKEIPNSFIPGQFTNPANPKAHKETTGPEIYKETQGKVDIFVAGIGTGGTITGVGEYLKEQNPNIQIVGVEPAEQPNQIQGIGAGFIPEVLNTEIYDELIKVTNQEAFETMRLLAKTEGILVGISSGAAAYAAIQLAKRPENKYKNIVVLLPDTGDRYLSIL